MIWTNQLRQRFRIWFVQQTDKLRAALRLWLGIDTAELNHEVGKLWDLHYEGVKLRAQRDDKLRTIEMGQEAVIERFNELNAAMAHVDEDLRRFVSEQVQSLQQQIDALTAFDGPLAKSDKKSPEPQPSQIMPGHVRFTDRKRRYEWEKRKPLETETGKQIAENERLINSGTRKEDAQ
jgi:hypothetical protein